MCYISRIRVIKELVNKMKVEIFNYTINIEDTKIIQLQNLEIQNVIKS